MITPRILVLAVVVALVGCAEKEVEVPIAIWESPPEAARHVKLTLYPKKSSIEYGHTPIDVVTGVRGSALFWVREPDEHGHPQPGTDEMQFAEVKSDGGLVVRIVPALMDDSRLAPYILQKRPNQESSVERSRHRTVDEHARPE